MEKFILGTKNFWDFLVHEARTEDKVGVAIAFAIIIGFIVFAIYDFRINRALKKEVDQFMTDNEKRISEIRIRIIKCDNLKDWPNVKTWAIAAANNIRSEIFGIDSTYGETLGNSLVKDITRMIFKKEEELIRELFK